MTPNEYQIATRRTANYQDRFKDLIPHMQIPEIPRSMISTINEMRSSLELDNWALGLAGEAGECADHLKKVIHHGTEADISHIEKELGDVLWYTCRIADFFGLTLEDVMAANIEKLKKRYPDTFNFEDANKGR